MKSNRIVVAFASIFIATTAYAAPSIPEGPNGTLFTCAEGENEFGCYGSLQNANGAPLGARRAKNKIKKLLRRTKRQVRKARRKGDTERVDALTLAIQTYKNIRVAIKECVAYDDPECSGGGGGGGGGGGTGGGGNQNVAAACNVVGGTGSDVQQRIVNGAICTQGDSPIVPIFRDGGQHCTGNMIASNLVLTAGHCVYGFSCSTLSVRDGSGNEQAGQNCVVHPSYDPNGQAGFEGHDVALITLNGNLSTQTLPVATSSVLSTGTQILIAGYGRNNTENPNYTGGGSSGDFRAGYNTVDSLTTGGVYVKFDPNSVNQSNSCNGDSGGGALAEVNGQWTLIGTVSWGIAQDCGIFGQSDDSVWARLSSADIQQFLADNTSGIVD